MVTTQTKEVTETKTVGWTEQSWGKELKEKIIFTPFTLEKGSRWKQKRVGGDILCTRYWFFDLKKFNILYMRKIP